MTPRRIAGHAARVVLGGIFLVAGILKGLDPAEFVHQVAEYGLIGVRAAALFAPALIVMEIVLGLALIAGVRPGAAAIGSVLLLAFFIAVETYGMTQGKTESCGCFGAYVERTPGQVIGEDLAFAGLAVLAAWGLRGWPGLSRARSRAIVVTGTILAGLYVLFSPRLPIDDYVTRLRVGRSMADLDLANRVPDLVRGRHLVALFDVTDPRAADLAAGLGTIVATPGAPAVTGLTPSPDPAIDAFRWTAVPSFEVVRIDRDVIKRLYRRLPRFFVVDEGRVVAVYDGAPPGPEDLLSSRPS